MRSLKNVFMRPTERLLSHLLMENQAVYLCFVFISSYVRRPVYKKNHSKYIFVFIFFLSGTEFVIIFVRNPWVDFLLRTHQFLWR